MNDTFQLNVADVPIIKLVKALADGGFRLRTNAQGELMVEEFEVVLDLTARPKVRNKPPVDGDDLEWAQPTMNIATVCECGSTMCRVMMPPLCRVTGDGEPIKLEPKWKCMACGYVVHDSLTPDVARVSA